MPMEVKYISNQLHQLQQELMRHPNIKEKCKDCEGFSQTIATIAAEVDVVLDGYYDEEAMNNLFVVLRNRLEDKRTGNTPGIILTR